MAERRRRAEEEATAAAEEYGKTTMDLPLLRELVRRKGCAAKEEDINTLYAFFDEKGLSTVDQVRDHHAVLYDQVKDYLDDHEMALKKLCEVLASKRELARNVSGIHRNKLLVDIPGASESQIAAGTLRQALDMCATVCEQYKAEEKDRNSSEYEIALEALEEAQQLSPDVKAQWVARGKLYDEFGVLASCVNVKTFNDDVLGTSFDKTLHLPAGALDLSAEGYTPHLAAEPGAASRLALSRIGDVPTRRPPLISNLIIRVDGVVKVPPRRRRRATPSTRPVPRRRLICSTRILRRCGSVIVGCPWPYLRLTTLPNVAT